MALALTPLTSNQVSSGSTLSSSSVNVPADTLLVAIIRHTNASTSAWANINSFTDNKGNTWTQKAVGHFNSNAGTELTLEYWWTYVTAAQTGMVATAAMSKNIQTLLIDIVGVSGVPNPAAPFDDGATANKISGGQSSGGSFGSYSSTVATMGIYTMYQEDQGDPSKLITSPSGTTNVRLHDRLNGLGFIGQISYKQNPAPLTNQAVAWTPGGISSGGIYGALSISDAPYTPPAPRQVTLNMMQ